jgi:hypothetical protein
MPDETEMRTTPAVAPSSPKRADRVRALRALANEYKRLGRVTPQTMLREARLLIASLAHELADTLEREARGR